MNGQSFYQGALIGGLSAGGSKFLGEKFRFGELGSPEDYAGRMAVGGTVAAITASFTGGNPLQTFAYSALIAGIAYTFNDLKMENWSEYEKEYFAHRAIATAKDETPFERCNRRYIANKLPFSDDQKLEIAKASGVVMGVMFGGAAVGVVAAGFSPYAAYAAGTKLGQMFLLEFLPSTLPVLPYEPTIAGVFGAMTGNGIQYLYRNLSE